MLPGDWLPEGGPLPVVHSILDSAPAEERDIPLPAPRPPAAIERTRVSLVYVPRDPELALQASLAATLVNWTKNLPGGGLPAGGHSCRPDAVPDDRLHETSPPTTAHRMRREPAGASPKRISQAAAAASGRFWTSRYLRCQ
jgi:hypothetical protein